MKFHKNKQRVKINPENVKKIVLKATCANIVSITENDMWEITKEGMEMTQSPYIRKKAIGALFYCTVSNTTTIGEIMEALENKQKYCTDKANIMWSCHRVIGALFEIEELYVYK